MEDPASLKCEEQAAHAAHIMAMAALKYQQLDNVTGESLRRQAKVAVVRRMKDAFSRGWSVAHTSAGPAWVVPQCAS